MSNSGKELIILIYGECSI